MKKTFFYLLGSVFTIIGSVIGAGFITGKEISVFFCRDFSLSGVYAAFVFFFLFIFLLSVCEDDPLNDVVGFVVAVTGIVIASCMTAALNSLFESLLSNVLHNTENYKIFTIITVIFTFFICLKGVGAMNVVSSLVMPFVLVFVVVLSLSEESGFIPDLSPSGFGGAGFPLLYVGINCLLSSKVIVDSLKGFSVAKKMIAALSVSFILCVCILCIALCVCGKSDDMPFLSALSNNVIYSKIAVVITFFSIITTLVASAYSAFTLAKGKTSVLQKIIITLVFVMLSRFGFSSFVEIVYPVFGFFGAAYFIALCVSSALNAFHASDSSSAINASRVVNASPAAGDFSAVNVSSKTFRVKRRSHTSRQQECRVLPSKP